MRIAFDDSGGNISPTPNLRIGVLASPTAGLPNGPLTAFTTNFWGVGSLNPGDFVRVAGPPVCYTAPMAPTVRVTNTNTTGASGSMRFSAAPSSIRGLYVVSLWKGTDGVGDWNSFSLCPVTSSLVDNDISTEQYEDILRIGIQNAAQGTGMTEARDALNAITGATDYQVLTHGARNCNEGANGAFNSLCVAWNSTASICHISEIKYVKHG